MTAHLPMYMRPELKDAHDTFWSLIFQHLKVAGIDAPLQLSQPDDFMQSWLNSSLVLSQTCGMPYRNSLHGKVQLVGTPDYQLDGCLPGYYRSAIVVRRTDAGKQASNFKNSTLAFNSTESQSGYAAAFEFFKDIGFWFDKKIATGGHHASAMAVADGSADIAALDAVTWRLLSAYESFTDQLVVLDWTKPTPGLPYITSLGHDRQTVFEAVSAAIAELPQATSGLLGIHGLVVFDAEDYLQVQNPDG